MKTNFLLKISLLLLIFSGQVYAQNTNNYIVTAGSTETLTTMTGSTSLIGANKVNVASAITPITATQDFEFWFMGTRYTQFSVSSNGILRFGNVPINSDANTPSLNFQQRICAFASGDGTDVAACATGTDGDWRTSGTGKIHFRVTGTTPDRILTTEWLNMEMAAGTTTADGTFQVRIHETQPANTNGGRIEIIYGAMKIPVAATNCGANNNQSSVRVGMGISTNNNEFISLLSTGHPSVAGGNISRTATLDASYTADNMNPINLNGGGVGTSKFYNFVSVAPNGTANNLGVCPSSTNVTLNWTNTATAAFALGYAIYRSNDGGATYQFETQVNGLTNLVYTSTGLSPNTTYFYRVYVVSEGKLSALGGTAQTSVTTTATPIIYSLRDGNWSDATLWTSGTVPTGTQNVVIGCTTGHAVTVDIATATSNNLTLLANSKLIINSNQKVTINGNFTVNNTGTLPKIDMTSTSPSLELKGHWIDLDATVVAAGSNGILSPGTTSTVIFSGAAQQIINANNTTPTTSTVQTNHPLNFANLTIDGTDVQYIFNDNKGSIISDVLIINTNKTLNYSVNAVSATAGLSIGGNMVNNGTLNNVVTNLYTSMNGATKTITGTGTYTNFPLQITNTGSVSLNTNATMRQLLVSTGGTFTVQNTPRTYTLTRSATGSTTVDLNNAGTLNFSGANIVLGTTLDGTATANLINTGTFNAGTNSNFTFSGAGAQTVSNTGGVAATSTFTAPAYTAAVAITDNRTGFVAFGATLVTPPTETNLMTNGAVAMPITVPAGTYTSLTSIAFNITQTFNADLEIYLVAPNGTTFEISTDNGGGVGGGYVGVIVNNTGGNFPTGDTNPITGTFRPEGALFSTYGGALAGTWKLYVLDDGAGDTGSIQNFTLNLGNATFNAGTGFILDDIPNNGIAANNTIPSSTNLFNSGGAFASATVPVGTYSSLASISFSITQTQNDNLDIYLLAPDNTVFVVSTDNGGSGNGYTSVIVTDGGAAFPIGNTNPITGTFTYEAGGGVTFANYPAASCAGIWRLYVFDDAGSNTGSITNFSVTMNLPPLFSELFFHNLITNNTSTTGTTLLNTQITINNSTTFTSGRLFTSEAFRVNYIAGATTSLANSNSYIVGWARKTGNTTFEYPLGDGGFAAPIRFAPTSGSAITDHFTATYRKITPNTGSANDVTNVNTGAGLNTAPYPIATKQASIDHVSNVEYWILERTNGAAQGTVTLSYDDTRSKGAGVPSELLVCRWNKATPIWENKGNGGTSSGGGFTYVSSTAAAFTAFSPITLGSTTRFNVLPVSWISFDAVRQNTNALLKWQTQSEENNAYFEVERSFDGINFVKIAQVEGAKNSITDIFYSFTDKNINEMNTKDIYYRIKQVDIDGKNSYTLIKNVIVESMQCANFLVYPNPFSNTMNIEFILTENETVQLELIDISGKILETTQIRGNSGKNTYTMTTNNLPVGTYLLRMQTLIGMQVSKVVKE